MEFFDSDPQFLRTLRAGAELAEAGCYDRAARSLSDLRKKAAKKCLEDWRNLKALLDVVKDQTSYLRQADALEKSRKIGEWFLHFYAQAANCVDPAVYKATNLACRESFSRFFASFALTLAQSGFYADMRSMVRASVDLTAFPQYAIACVMPQYAKLYQTQSALENVPARAWLADRLAEFLARLDFGGFGDHPFRRLLASFFDCISETQSVQDRRASFDRFAKIYHNMQDRALFAPVYDALEDIRPKLETETETAPQD